MVSTANIEFRRLQYPPYLFRAYWRGTGNLVEYIDSDNQKRQIGDFSSPQKGHAQLKKLRSTNTLV